MNLVSSQHCTDWKSWIRKWPIFITCERQVVCESKSLLDAVIDLIAVIMCLVRKECKVFRFFLTLCVLYEVFTAIPRSVYAETCY